MYIFITHILYRIILLNTNIIIIYLKMLAKNIMISKVTEKGQYNNTQRVYWQIASFVTKSKWEESCGKLEPFPDGNL